MLNWLWPYAFLLLPLPILWRWLMPARDAAQGALRVPFFGLMETLSHSSTTVRSTHWLRAILCWLIWLALVCAVARPTFYGDPVQVPQERRDLMLAVDISLSMKEADMAVQGQYVQRVQAVKYVVGNFVEQRKGDRLGLILFGEQGYLQTPLTFDANTVNQQLQEAQLGFAGNATAIGDAIGLAVKHLRDRPADSRVLILLTDGANTAGTDPVKATAVAAEAGIRIYTVGVGADTRVVRGMLGGSRVMPVATDLDEPTLQAIANSTGGQYFRARNPDELADIYAELDRLEPIPEDQTFRPTISLSHWAILAALLLILVLLLVTHWSRASNAKGELG
ncbi:vWA domain-containing protein [Arenicella xantha]|uniref:Ca-activated chloride channel family protein n=1 Tax=Arenicella xantha TaxID=644221 RepID=A0A395JNY1_9GAMM|nr:VWA domain-containing protein [Arenicella xantha]RBP51288.1 Ca-activated chloride channel family protein [Arenicella xantha]